MAELRPVQAASLASDVYALTADLAMEDALQLLNRKYNDQFTFSDKQLLRGKTGAPFFIRCRTAFGFTLLGQKKLGGHGYILFRGTQYLADWITNVSAAVSSTSTGMPVHFGFNQTFCSMKPALAEFMAEAAKTGVRELHCIGHSLGGALANICADWVAGAYKMRPYLYTFGSPRVGLQGFADNCTKVVGAQSIFRAYHTTDIVPCMPIWPFLHAPVSGADYYLPSPGVIPMVEYHRIQRYRDTVRRSSWEELAGLKREQKNRAGIENWLKQSTPVGLTITSIEWLSEALLYVLERCMSNAARLISTTFSTTFTLMDQLAFILRKGIALSENVSSLILLLIRKILHILGMTKALEATDLTREFIRSVLLRLHARVSELSRAALSKALVSGRAI
ncbi:lipase family protein [Proteobacteria bacterium 005FR1]|nr:lipase family protein [Proteobacteria bacterium 005FR1]